MHVGHAPGAVENLEESVIPIPSRHQPYWYLVKDVAGWHLALKLRAEGIPESILHVRGGPPRFKPIHCRLLGPSRRLRRAHTRDMGGGLPSAGAQSNDHPRC